MVNIKINNRPLSVPEGTTILAAAKELNITIPTLCFLEGYAAMGACRVCLVEVTGARTLMASCATAVQEGMEINTMSHRVIEARKTVVELLLSEHCGECQYCDRNNNCELQSLAFDLAIKEQKYQGEETLRKIDDSTPALVRDSGKCIKCRRCITVCREVQGVAALFPQNRGFSTIIGPAFTRELDSVNCVQCGQCVAVCPVGAITEKDHISFVLAALQDKSKHVVVQTAPAIRAALGEEFALEPGTLVTGKMTTALKNMGFDAVFDTNFTADLTIIEEGTELLMRLKNALVLKKEVALPQLSSCSPGWIKFMEHFYPDQLDNLSSCKSPQQMFGALAKTYYAQKMGIKPEDMVVVSVMPCTAKKFEAQRPEMFDSGVQDVDYVLTTRELGRLIKSAGINFLELSDSEMDAPLGISSGAADIFANSGGVMEAALRTVYEIVTGKDFPMENLHVKELAGLKGIKEASVLIEETVPDWSFLKGVEVKVAVAHGLKNAATLMDLVKEGKSDHHFIEIMTCPGGCIGGGGQPRFTTNDIRVKRIQAIYQEDEGKTLRKSHENPGIQKLYAEFLKEPLGEKSHHLLHTKYVRR
ncbi:MAG: NADH-dependent [FeFe] hydrogenase, group A6 [Spirochaetaceae bacterium]|jgi:NADP-reducing hydrogenase subunit HndD|nr:NADH-dependent [FeFe] hydrogenase, group A6 [Spirochaetaceae bacterium]